MPPRVDIAASVWKTGGFGRRVRRLPLLRLPLRPKALTEMIISCPACRTRYVVPDTAIGLDGRTVRCAKCKHSWFQDGPEPTAAAATASPAAAAAPETAAEPAPTEPAAAEPVAAEPAASEPSMAPAGNAPEPASRPPQPSVNFWRRPSEASEAPQAAPAAPPPTHFMPAASAPGASEEHREEEREAAPAPVEPPEQPAYTEASDADEDDGGRYSQFGYEPPFRPRRNPAKLWTAAALLFAVSAMGAIVAINVWGMPSWLPFERPVFGMNRPGLELDFPPEQQDLRTLPNGSEYLEVRGAVTNTARETLSLPTITIALRNEQDQIVYTWEIVPPRRELAPGETLPISEAMVDVPRSARIIEIGWTP